MADMNREKLFCIITEASFALDDCRLFLDTHPCNKEALEYFDKYQEVRKQAIKEYTECYGPIVAYDVNVENVWTWINNPWPWEGAC